MPKIVWLKRQFAADLVELKGCGWLIGLGELPDYPAASQQHRIDFQIKISQGAMVQLTGRFFDEDHRAGSLPGRLQMEIFANDAALPMKSQPAEVHVPAFGANAGDQAAFHKFGQPGPSR